MRIKSLALIVFTLLTAAACSGRQVQEQPLSSHSAKAEVAVTFNVLVPATTPDEDIQLSILDEVTGLAFNPHRYSMRPVAENTYAATISAPIGTLISYRYVRQGDVTTAEAAPNAQSISQRRFLVTGSGLIANDLVSAWTDQATEMETGQLSGQVTDAESGTPLGNLLVSASGIETYTDAEGYFVLSGLYQGQHTLVISSLDGAHQSFQQAALIAAGMDTPASIQLQRNDMISVTLRLTPPEDSVPAVPLYVIGNLVQLGAAADSPDDLPRMQPQSDGSYVLTLLLPTGVDIRYKYSFGDGFWNAEHLAGGGFAVRQMIIPTNQSTYEVEDQVSRWTSGSSAAIWFELDVPADPAAAQIYLQFRLLDWLEPLPMWPLGDGRWAYKLFSPTNFASALEYRYCADSTCSTPENNEAPRTITGNQNSIQLIQDMVSAWQTP